MFHRMGADMLPALEVLLAIQVMQVSVGGTVRDETTGVPLGGVTVALTDLNRATSTDADGRYILRDIPAGAQHLRVRILGHAPRTLHALVPPDGHLEINVSLRAIAFALSPIEVRAPVSVRGTGLGNDGAFPDRATSIAAVRSNPLLAEPDVFQAIGGGEVVLKPESPSGVHIRGGSSDQTAYVLDGIPVFSPYHTGASFSAWNPDALSHLYLSATVPSATHPAALAGTVAGVTRTPGPAFNAQGSATTTQMRLTVDGPIGGGGAGYLISLRSAFPGIVGSRREASYLAGNAGDWLAKFEAPAFGGRMRLLGYESENDISIAAAAKTDLDVSPSSGRNIFEWHSRSLGAEWRRDLSTVAVRLLGWSARGDASALWRADSSKLVLAADRRDAGFLVTVEKVAGPRTTLAGIRVDRIRTLYRVDSDSASLSWQLTARTPVISLFAEDRRPVGPRLELESTASIAAASGGVYASPRAQVRWHASEQVSFSGSYARLHQFAQSLRNSESVAGNIFPADLFVGAEAQGVPVARGDQGILGGEYRPSAGVRLGAQAYVRVANELLLVAPREGEPFTTREFAVGSGSARGVAVDATISSARYAIIGSYGLQRVRFENGDSSYVPDHGTAHLLDGGIIVLPTATSSIRLGLTGALGRRTTSVSGNFEWEACNLSDRGCEFGGSPQHGGQPLGAAVLPAYLRVDLGVKKHWHFEVGARDVVIEAFGTVTNILNRKNLLTYATDPSTGESVAVEMRPRAPLVFGIDWRF